MVSNVKSHVKSHQCFDAAFPGPNFRWAPNSRPNFRNLTWGSLRSEYRCADYIIMQDNDNLRIFFRGNLLKILGDSLTYDSFP